MGDDSNLLDALVAQVEDDTLRSRLAREIELLRGSRRFGLVFDRHLPESARLPEHPIRKGVQVTLRDESAPDRTWRVLGFTDSSRTVALLDGQIDGALDGNSQEYAEVSVERLVVVREFGEPVYPGFRSVERIARGPADAPWHTVVNGENFHVLQALRSTHRESVDLIYIDPPYNTGNEGWIYNDRYVDANDRAKSSKWLSFMEKRLLIARDLLKPTGVIIVAIGDEEHHRLRMLLDQVFGAQNFISDVVWQGGRKNDSRYVSNGADYMLIYAKDESAMSAQEIRWREPRPAQQEMLDAARRCWEESGHNTTAATALMKKWIKALPIGHAARENNRFYEFDQGTGRVFRKDNVSWPGGGGPRYDVIHPATGKPVRVPGSGWRYPTPERMHEMIESGRILFGRDHTQYINRKLYLDESETVVAESVFQQKRTSASTRLQSVLGDKRFPNPKDHSVLMRWIRIAAPKDAVVLDFFGGSGTTTEAVLRLNAEDGGTRQSILVTNNEVGAKQAKTLRKDGHHPGDAAWEELGVFEYVTRPRISTVVTGTRPDGSAYSDGLEANVEFLQLTYLDPGMVRRGREFEAIAPLLWLRAGGVGERIDTVPETGWALTPAYGILFEPDALAGFVEAVGAAWFRDVASAPPQPAMTPEPPQPAMTPEPPQPAMPQEPPQPAVTPEPPQPAVTPGASWFRDVASAPPQPAMTAEGARPPMTPGLVFVVTDSETEYQHAVERLPIGVETVQLYEDYLSNFTINVEGGAR